MHVELKSGGGRLKTRTVSFMLEQNKVRVRLGERREETGAVSGGVGARPDKGTGQH